MWAGPTMCLPTSRSARFASGLGVQDFMKRTTFLGCDAAELLTIGPGGGDPGARRGPRGPCARRRAAAGAAGVSEERTDRVVALELDQKSIVRWSPEVEHERNVAIFDLLEDNRFDIVDGPSGPYRVRLSLRDATLVLDVAADEGGERHEIALAVRPLRRVVKDYFMICESYFQAIKGATPSRIEAIDMARRGLHDEGSALLREALATRVQMDHDTARRLFTLVCVLHVRG